MVSGVLSQFRMTACGGHLRRHGESAFPNTRIRAVAPEVAGASIPERRQPFQWASLQPFVLRVPLRSGSAVYACFTHRPPLRGHVRTL